MSHVRRILVRCFAALTAALVALGLGVPARAASGSTRVILSVTQSFINRSASQVNDLFQYELTPLEEGNPMPGSDGARYSFSIRGSGKKLLLPITFDKVGVYRYQLRQIIPEKKRKGYSYDEQVYTVEVYVTNAVSSLTATTVVNSKDGEKAGEIFFENSYQRPADPVSSVNPVVPVNPIVPVNPFGPPKTGDSVDPKLWLALLILGAVGLLATQRMGKKRQIPEPEETENPETPEK